MVNFNFGLGGSTNDDDKKDDTSTTQDDSSVQDPVTQSDTSVSGDDTNKTDDLLVDTPAAEESAVSVEEKASEPVFDETVRETESSEENLETSDSEGSFSPFDEEIKEEKTEDIAEETPSSPILEVPSFEIPAPVTTPKTEDPAKIEDSSVDIEDTSDLNNDLPFSAEDSTEEKTEEALTTDDSFSVEKSNDTVDNSLTESVSTEEVPVPSFEVPAPVETENVAESTETTEVAPATENPFPSASVPVVPPVESKPETTTPSMGVLPTNISETKQEEPKVERPSVASVNPLPSMSIPPVVPTVEKVEEKKETPSLVGGKLPSINGLEENPKPEIPAFGQPEKESADLLAPKSTDGDLFGASTSDDALDLEETIDPLSAAPVARIGEAPEEISPVLGGNMFGDDDDISDDVNPAKNLSTDPLATLQKLKDDISGFVESHNAKISEYNDQITELNKKISEEKNVLKEKQKKSKKILEDLTALVSDFFHKETKKESHKKEKKTKK